MLVEAAIHHRTVLLSDFLLSLGPTSPALFAMTKHMAPKAAAMAHVFRNPPKAWKVKKLRFKEIPVEIAKAGFPRPTLWQVKWQAKNFGKEVGRRGRKTGWRKTSPAEDKTILATFQKVRLPLGSAVESGDVFNALPDALRQKVSARTVRERLRERGFEMGEKKAVDDKGDAWRKRREAWCKPRRHWGADRWCSKVQAVADFKLFTYYHKRLKARFEVKSCHRTIMSKGERNKPAFQKPKKSKIFRPGEYKKGSKKCKVFGLTTSNGKVLILPCKKLYPKTEDWVKMVPRIAGFLKDCFPDRRTFTLLLDGETILRTDEAQAAMTEHGLKVLPDWPPHSPDLNPQENMWAWAEPRLRKAEKKTDSFAVFKRRVAAVCKKYPSPARLVPDLAKRIDICMKRRGAHVGK